MERIEFKQITKEEYLRIKKEVNAFFKFTSMKRNNQQYALGGFSLNPKDYDNGFTNEEIDKLCKFLKSLNIDTQALNIQDEEVYGSEHGNFAGTKKKHLTLKMGIHFLMRLDK